MTHDPLDIDATILVTGATGFLGRPTARLLVEQGVQVHGVSRKSGPRVCSKAHYITGDLLNLNDQKRIVRETKPTHLLATAWITRPGEYAESPVNDDWRQATLELARVFIEQGGRRIVMVGTAAEYDWSRGNRLSEETTPIKPTSRFASAKARLHQQLIELTSKNNVALAWARLFWLYGPAEHPERMIPQIARALLAGEPVEVPTQSDARDFLHVEDAADALARLTCSTVSGAINIASGEAVSLRRMAEGIARIAGRPDLIRVLPESPSTSSLTLAADTTRMRRELGFRPSLGIEEGLCRTFAWWRQRRAA